MFRLRDHLKVPYPTFTVRVAGVGDFRSIDAKVVPKRKGATYLMLNSFLLWLQGTEKVSLRILM